MTILLTSVADPTRWLPNDVRTYLEHVGDGHSIRSLARRSGCHASTVLRQVRRCEQRRDDPLVDHALDRLERSRPTQEGNLKMIAHAASDFPDAATIESEARRILRRLAEPGACLAVADGMEIAVVVRDGPDGETVKTGSVRTTIAEAMALKAWIAPGGSGRVLRYRITGAGRTALKAFLAEDENCRALARADEDTPDRGARYGLPDSPLQMLARRRDKDGAPFLAPDLVRAGERLREDYEIAVMWNASDLDWEALSRVPGDGNLAPARIRLAAALAELGPGLADVTLRVCGRLEGLETTEKRMGWAARSGKIVLRIGLQRLARHYDKMRSDESDLIG